MKGRGWCGHLLNVDAANVSNSHVFILGMLLTVHLKGNFVGCKGGGCLAKQPQGGQSDTAATAGVLSFTPTPSLVSPAIGNDLGIMCNSVSTCQDKYRPLTSGVTKAIRLVLSKLASTDRNTAPIISMGCLFAAAIFCFTLTKSFLLNPDL